MRTGQSLKSLSSRPMAITFRPHEWQSWYSSKFVLNELNKTGICASNPVSWGRSNSLSRTKIRWATRVEGNRSLLWIARKTSAIIRKIRALDGSNHQIISNPFVQNIKVVSSLASKQLTKNFYIIAKVPTSTDFLASIFQPGVGSQSIYHVRIMQFLDSELSFWYLEYDEYVLAIKKLDSVLT